MNASTAIALGQLALAFGRVNRVTFHEDGTTPESDTDHTVMLGLIACTACPAWIDRGRVAEFVLVHDVVEARCGDTNTFGISDEGRKAKKEREAVAFASLREEFGECWLTRTLEAYEEQREPAARLVRYLDKAMPKITHILNNGVSTKIGGKGLEDVVDHHREQFATLNLEYPEFNNSEVSHLLRTLMALTEDAFQEGS